MIIGITGYKGFIGQNLTKKLDELNYKWIGFGREDSLDEIKNIDILVHLAAINRPQINETYNDNIILTNKIINELNKNNQKIGIILSSTIQAKLDNEYGNSKVAVEKIMNEYTTKANTKFNCLRLNNLFGPLSRPNYNSFIATLCYSIIHDIPFKINDSSTILTLSYIDDVVSVIIKLLNDQNSDEQIVEYKKSLNEIHKAIIEFNENRKINKIPKITDEFNEKLYVTYQSYINYKIDKG